MVMRNVTRSRPPRTGSYWFLGRAASGHPGLRQRNIPSCADVTVLPAAALWLLALALVVLGLRRKGKERHATA